MFNNAGHALSWAYNTESRPIVKMSGINHMRQVPTPTTQNLLLLGFTLHDLHAQAAQIIGMVEKLPGSEQIQCVKARFGRELSRDDLRVLVYAGCDVSGLGLANQEPVYRIVHSYFAGGIPYRDIRRMLGCRDQYAIMIKRCLYDALDIIHHRAMADMTDILERKGLIENRGSIPVVYG